MNSNGGCANEAKRADEKLKEERKRHSAVVSRVPSHAMWPVRRDTLLTNTPPSYVSEMVKVWRLQDQRQFGNGFGTGKRWKTMKRLYTRMLRAAECQAAQTLWPSYTEVLMSSSTELEWQTYPRKTFVRHTRGSNRSIAPVVHDHRIRGSAIQVIRNLSIFGRDATPI